MKTLILCAMVLLLLAAPANAAEPTNYCTAVTVQPPQNTGEPYTITVTAGSGSYWRVREYASGVVVIPPVYDPTVPVTLSGVLTAGVEYQVQAAHAAGGPWSTAGCRFVAESALGAYFEYAILADGILEWQTMQDPLWFVIYQADGPGGDGWMPTATVPSVNPLGPGPVYRLKTGEGVYRVCGSGFFGWIWDCEDAQ